MPQALIRTACLAAVLIIATAAPADPKPNFYLPATTDAAPPTPKPSSPPKPSPKPAPAKTPAPKISAPTQKLSDADAPKKSKPTAHQAASTKAFRPALDAFGLAKSFETRWDLTTFLITGAEELKFRIDAARASTHRLARAFSALATQVDQRQRNLNAAALAAYLLSRDQATWQPIAGRNLTEGQSLAVRVTMGQDMQAMDSALTDYETLRTSLNASADHLAQLERQGLAASPPNALADADRPTLPLNQVARAQTNAVLEERTLSVETLKAILSTEVLSTSADTRQSIASFAPPPPSAATAGGNEEAARRPPPRYTTADKIGLDTVPTTAPGELQPRRRQQTAMLLPTAVNAPVLAPKNGVVVFAGPFRGYGSTVIIEHEKGTFSIYAHLGSIQARERQPIKAGEILGRAGTPPELGRSGIHFQVRKGAVSVPAEQWLPSSQALVKAP